MDAPHEIDRFQKNILIKQRKINQKLIFPTNSPFLNNTQIQLSLRDLQLRETKHIFHLIQVPTKAIHHFINQQGAKKKKNTLPTHFYISKGN